MKIISKDCSKQKCYLSFDSPGHENENQAADYVIGRVSCTLLECEQSRSYSRSDIKDVFPGLAEIVLHISTIPTRSVLVLKTESRLSDEEAAEIPKPNGMTQSEFSRRKLIYFDERRYYSAVEIHDIALESAQGNN